MSEALKHLQQEAKLYYQRMPLEERLRLLDKFKSVDKDHSGGISRTEVWNMWDDLEVRDQGLRYFDVLDMDKSGTLNFWECITLYYLLYVPGKICQDCCNIHLRQSHCNVCNKDLVTVTRATTVTETKCSNIAKAY